MEDDLPTGTGLTLPVGGSVTANIDFYRDIDAFSVTLEAGETYQFDVSGIGLNPLADPVLSLADPFGVIIAKNDNFFRYNPRIEFTASASREYFLYVEGFSGGQGNFRISATQTSQPPITTVDDYPVGTSGFLSVGSFTLGNIETATDIDSFRVDLVEGFTYRLTARGSDTADGTLADPMLELIDPSGDFIADNDSGFGRNAELSSFVAPSTGSYNFRVYSADFSSTGTYFVSASQTAEPPVTTFDDYPLGTSGFLSVGSFTTGNIETATDIDSFRVDLVEGFTYRLTARGSDTADGTLADPVLELIDPSGDFIADNDSGFGRNAELSSFVAPSTGSYEIRVYSADFSSTGTYFVSASQTAEPPVTTFDDYPTGTNGTVTVGQSTSGNIETAGDSDTFRVFLARNVTYEFDLVGTSASDVVSLSDPFLQLGGLSGEIVTTDDDGGSGLNSKIEFTAGSDGFHFLTVEGVGFSTGVYEVSATRTGFFDPIFPEPTTPEPTTPEPTTPEPTTPTTPIVLTQSSIDEMMSGIRDFDGNQFSSTNSWRYIGQTDIQGDGDTELVLVNADLGRWATLGVQDDEMIDFSAYGAGGDTRVVGIYIDPLVASGEVQRGSGNDSQTRFQNDLKIGNLVSVLGADDYDGDGFQEVYFGLGDGGAVLHAYMHADGNIRYANYQSETDLNIFMGVNGVSSSVYDDWF